MNCIFSIPVEAIERVELSSGTSSTLYGSEAFAGVVNITTKQDWHLNQKNLLEANINVCWGSLGNSVIFKQINTGGTRLSNQEIRHALNPVNATKFLAKLAASQEFRQVINLSESKKTHG